jgi:putative ATP-dependent endonuclease of OLD family
VNVGGVGLRRFARILQRKNAALDGEINVPVACVTDLDVMPDCAPEIIGKVKPGEAWPKGRRWRAKKDFPGDALAKRRAEIQAKASGQNVQTFVADEWTLEYDLAFSGLDNEVWLAAHLAKADEKIHAGTTTVAAVVRAASRSFRELNARTSSREEMCSHVYELFADGSSVSKTVAAQYLACILNRIVRKGVLNAETLSSCLPKYLNEAIAHVTYKPSAESARASK